NEFVNAVEQTLEIVEFSDRQIRNFLKAWEPELPPEKSIEQLISTLRDRPQIIALARNPLLLTIVAYLYADTSFILPHSRASFYEEAVTHLLKLRDEERQINNQFEAIHKRRVLQKLALYAQDNARLQERDRRNIEYEEVLDQVRVLLPSLNLNPERDTQAILAEIVDRSGLFLPIDGGQRYQFSHLTLQEYFAAEALANQEDGLVNRFKQDTVTWRETVKLWCGLAGNKTSFIKQVYRHNALTGFECLAEAKEVDQALADEIINYYKQQLEKANNDDDLAKAFGSVAADVRESSRGKSVLEFLEVALNNNADLLNQKASAKALSFTNLPQAAKILAEGYKKNKEYGESLSSDNQENCLESIRAALIRMGDLAVPQLAKLAEQTND
ncbi:MAG: NACHT domain protein, partial [Cyanobacteria bacterium P01_F01_bin.143]